MPDESIEEIRNSIAPGEIRSLLKRVLRSSSFSNSPRLSRFLAFTVESALSEERPVLKEYTIATEVYDRKESFDPIQDSIVRTEARRLRRKLKEYFEQDGRGEVLLIQFRTGSYIPIFVPRPQENGTLQTGLEPKEPISTPLGVIPFQAADSDPLTIACAEGVTEELLHRLSVMPSVAVVLLEDTGRQGITGTRGHGEPLIRIGGTVRCQEGRIRVTARVATVDGFQLLSQRYEQKSEPGELPILQASIAIGLLSRIIPYYPFNYHHAASHYPAFDQIFAEVLAAEGLLEEGSVPSISRALNRLERIALEAPDYARVHCSISKCCLGLLVRGVSDADGLRERGLEASRRALELDSNMADGYANQGCLLGLAWKWEESEHAMLKSIAIADQHSTRWLYAMLLLAARRFEEAGYNFSISAEEDSLSPRRRIATERFRYYSGRFRQVAADHWKIISFVDVPTEVLLYNALGEIERGDKAHALSIAQFVRSQHPDVPPYLAAVAEIHALCGEIAEANTIIQRGNLLSDGVALSSFRKAGLCLTRGLTEDALGWLQHALNKHESDLVWMYSDPRYAPLRNNATYQTIARKVFGTWISDI